MAQSVARLVRNEKVRGSSPLSSTDRHLRAVYSKPVRDRQIRVWVGVKREPVASRERQGELQWEFLVRTLSARRSHRCARLSLLEIGHRCHRSARRSPGCPPEKTRCSADRLPHLVTDFWTVWGELSTPRCMSPTRLLSLGDSSVRPCDRPGTIRTWIASSSNRAAGLSSSLGPAFWTSSSLHVLAAALVAADLRESSVDRPGAASYLVKLHAARPASSEMSVAFCESREDFVRSLMRPERHRRNVRSPSKSPLWLR